MELVYAQHRHTDSSGDLDMRQPLDPFAAIAAIPYLLWGLLTENESMGKPLGYAMDRVLAVLCGFSGQHTLSACLATGIRLQWLRKVVDWLEAGHCEKAAKTEGLLK